MSHPYVHAESSVKIFGGAVEDYLFLHNWFDETKAWHPDWRHRAFRHHTEGIQEAVETFGAFITNASGNTISVQDIGIQHVIEDVGFIPTVEDWFEHFIEEEWQVFRKKRLKERVTNKAGDKIPRVMKIKLGGDAVS